VRELGVKVMRVLAKRNGVASSRHSYVVSRNEHMSSVSRCDKRIDRIPSFCQRQRKGGLAVAITCAYRLRRGKRGV